MAQQGKRHEVFCAEFFKKKHLGKFASECRRPRCCCGVRARNTPQHCSRVVGKTLQMNNLLEINAGNFPQTSSITVRRVRGSLFDIQSRHKSKTRSSHPHFRALQSITPFYVRWTWFLQLLIPVVFLFMAQPLQLLFFLFLFFLVSLLRNYTPTEVHNMMSFFCFGQWIPLKERLTFMCG